MQSDSFWTETLSKCFGIFFSLFLFLARQFLLLLFFAFAKMFPNENKTYANPVWIFKRLMRLQYTILKNILTKLLHCDIFCFVRFLFDTKTDNRTKTTKKFRKFGEIRIGMKMFSELKNRKKSIERERRRRVFFA